MTIVDAKGLACPQPVVLAKKALKDESSVTVLVDNEEAVKNLSKLANSLNANSRARQISDGFEVVISYHPTVDSVQTVKTSPTKATYLLASETIGSGERELGLILMRSFLYTLTENDQPPQRIILLNGGVKLIKDEQCHEHLGELASLGAEILGCGTCLDYYELKDDFTVGEVTNMYAIVEILEAGGVITIC